MAIPKPALITARLAAKEGLDADFKRIAENLELQAKLDAAIEELRTGSTPAPRRSRQASVRLQASRAIQ